MSESVTPFAETLASSALRVISCILNQKTEQGKQAFLEYLLTNAKRDVIWAALQQDTAPSRRLQRSIDTANQTERWVHDDLAIDEQLDRAAEVILPLLPRCTATFRVRSTIECQIQRVNSMNRMLDGPIMADDTLRGVAGLFADACNLMDPFVRHRFLISTLTNPDPYLPLYRLLPYLEQLSLDEHPVWGVFDINEVLNRIAGDGNADSSVVLLTLRRTPEQRRVQQLQTLQLLLLQAVPPRDLQHLLEEASVRLQHRLSTLEVYEAS